MFDMDYGTEFFILSTSLLLSYYNRHINTVVVKLDFKKRITESHYVKVEVETAEHKQSREALSYFDNTQ